MTKIAIVGGGAMGSIYASLLSQSEHEVWLVDIWQEHIDAIRQHGLRVDGPGEATRVVHLNATTSPADVGPADLVMLAVKAFATNSATPTIRQLLFPGGVALTMQNGLGNGERLAAAIPHAQIAIGVPGHGGALLKPGHVAHRVAARTHLGWLHGGPAEDLAAMLTRAGLETTATHDIQSLLWSHVAVVGGVNAIAALCRIPNIEVARVPEAARLSELAIGEIVEVAKACGVALPWADPVAACREVYVGNGEHHLSSMTVDILRERPTEIDVLNGAVVDHGRRLGIPTPVNEALVLAIRTVQRTTHRRASV